MKTSLLFFLLLIVFSAAAYAQAPGNDDPVNATLLTNLTSFCSNDGEFTNIKATPSFSTDQNKDVWFKFTAIAFDVSITVTGNGTNPLNSPGIEIYTSDPTLSNFTNIEGSAANGTTTTTLYKGGLNIGQTFFVRVFGAANNSTGTFKLCINNFNPVLKAGQDYGTASVLCSKASFTQTGVTGAGLNNRESAGTCLDANGLPGPIEANTAWYKWTAANNGTLTFTITPTVVAPVADDIDWVLYDLGTTGDAANVNAANAIRCASGSGVGCTGPEFYFKTGTSMTETDLVESPGCVPGQDGFVRFVDMIQGHVYGLLINNFSNGNNGFNLDFGGTGEFLGPEAAFTVAGSAPCTAGQVFTFVNHSSNYNSLSWSFGDGATPATATGDGPFKVTYSTTGNKTAVLQALGGQGCNIVADTTFTVGITPPKPVVTPIKLQFCIPDTLILNTPVVTGFTYLWTGPNNFSSTSAMVKVPITNINQAGAYVLQVTQDGCASDTAQVNLLSIGKNPIADFNITNNNLCTPQQSFTFTNNSTDFNTSQWDFGADATTTSINASTVNVTYSTFGQKTITLTLIGDEGCTTTLSKIITVPQKPAIPVITFNNNKVCVGDSITLSTVAQSNTTYLWSGPNGFTATTPVAKILATGTDAAGTYSLIVTQGLCSSDAAIVTIDPSQIIAIPIASFTASTPIPGSVFVPAAVQFTNTSTLADSYLWSFGDGNTATDVNPVHTYQTKGDFTVTLTATSQGLCNNTVMQGKLIVRYNVVIFIPNTFTPNGDGINDVFSIKITNTKNYHIQVFNRYGARLFEAYDINNSWNGLFRGQSVPIGTYYYVIDTTTLNDDVLKESGPITVIR